MDNRLETLTVNMIVKSAGQAPKLRARGAEARGLVLFAYEQTLANFSDDDPEEAAAKAVAFHMHCMYRNLSASVFQHESMADHSRKLAVLWCALEGLGATGRRRAKPKLHQMQELCETMVHNPSCNWTYRDEDFGGTMAALVRTRGGKATPKRVSWNALTKFFARHPMPSL